MASGLATLLRTRPTNQRVSRFTRRDRRGKGRPEVGFSLPPTSDNVSYVRLRVRFSRGNTPIRDLPAGTRDVDKWQRGYGEMSV
jgi:hypothetical protein